MLAGGNLLQRRRMDHHIHAVEGALKTLSIAARRQ